MFFLNEGGLDVGAFRRSAAFGFSLASFGSSPPYSSAGDSVYRCCLRRGWGSVVRMTHFVPFYCSLPLNPQPQQGGKSENQRNSGLTAAADEIILGWFVWAKAPTTSAVLGFLSVGAASFRPCCRAKSAATTRPTVRDTFPSENLKTAAVCVRVNTSATTPK